MANLLLIDSFDHYTTADIGKKWTAANIGSISAGTGRNGTASMRIVGSQNGPQFSVSNLPTVYVGFAFRLQNAGATMHMLRLLDGASIQLDMGITPSNFMVVKRGGATVVSTATTNALSAGAYYFLEARFTLHASAGSCEVRVNGVTVINDTGLNLITSANAYMNSVMLMSAAGTGNHDFDDFWMTTDAFLGDCRVVAVLPQGAGNYSQWTPSAGLGWQCVDEAAMNADTDYVSSAVAGQRNSYDFAPVGFTGNVKAVQQITTLRKDDAGSRTAQQFARISGTDYDSANITVLDSYTMQRRILTLNPATGAGWNTSDIDSGEFGTKVVS